MDINNPLKRVFDISLSLIGIILTCWLILIAWIIATIETRSNGFFLQKRVGKNLKTFNVIKIKTMRENKSNPSTITLANDERITKSGKIFRKMKLDELPQLWNIFIGEMSFVGPRPDVQGYLDSLKDEDKILFTVKPGLTGPAQLTYKKEVEILANTENPLKYNDEVIWPHKVEINKRYILEYSFFKDIYYIFKTIVGGNVKY